MSTELANPDPARSVRELHTIPRGKYQPLPDFFIVGTVKAGTTSLYNYLDQHPDVYMSPIKEPHFFSTEIKVENFSESYKKFVRLDLDEYLNGDLSDRSINSTFIRSWDDYKKLFKNVKNERVVGESSTSYLFSPVAAQNIYRALPDSRIIIMLRNPVQRAYSHYLMNYKSGSVTGGFDDELKSDLNRKPRIWGTARLYLDHGFYHDQVKRYFDVFGKEKVHIIIYDDFLKNPGNEVKKVYEFLELNSDYLADTTIIHNKAKVPSNSLARKILNQRFLMEKLSKLVPKPIRQAILKRLYTDKKLPEFEPVTRLYLQEAYREDIEKTSQLIGRDLTFWIKK